MHALRDKRRYTTLLHAVPKDMLAGETQTMLAWFAAYWASYPDSQRIEVPELLALIKLRSGTATPEQVAVTLHIASGLAEEPNADSMNGIVNQLTELDFAGRLGATLSKYNSGGEVDLTYEVQAMATEARRGLTAGGISTWADKPISEYFKVTSGFTAAADAVTAAANKRHLLKHNQKQLQ